MSKAKHTAWKVKTNVHPETNGDPWGWVGREVFGSGDAITGVSITWTGEKGRANARLIAASPELKSSLESLSDMVIRKCNIGNDPTLIDLLNEVQKAKELIKKIEE